MLKADYDWVVKELGVWTDDSVDIIAFLNPDGTVEMLEAPQRTITTHEFSPYLGPVQQQQQGTPLTVNNKNKTARLRQSAVPVIHSCSRAVLLFT